MEAEINYNYQPTIVGFTKNQNQKLKVYIGSSWFWESYSDHGNGD